MTKEELLEKRDLLKNKLESLNTELEDITRKSTGEFNQAALKRVRKLTLEITKIGKDFRQASLAIK